MKKAIQLGLITTLVATGSVLAVDDSKVTFKLALGGDNQAAQWENPADCTTNLNPPFLPGDPNDNQSFQTNSKITWEARVAVSGTHGGLAPAGVANLVFDLELRDGSGNLVTSFGAGDANTQGWYSSINNETSTPPATKRHNPTGSGGCGITAADVRQLAGFAVSFQVAAPNFYGRGRVIDQASLGGPYLGYYVYPSALGFPAASTATGGKLLGMGAGYRKFLGSGCPFSNAGGEYCKYTTAEVTTPGVGLTAGCATGQWADVPEFEGQLNTKNLPAGNYTLTLVPGRGINLLDGSIDCVALRNPGKFAFKPDVTTGNGDSIAFSLVQPQCNRTIAGRYIFYNHSRWDGNNAGPTAPDANTLAGGNNRNDDQDAIPVGKTPLLPNRTIRATTANFINYSRGINGLIVDVLRGQDCTALPDTLTAADFTFKYGNNNAPAGWLAANNPTIVKVFQGVPNASTDRIELIWPDLDADIAAGQVTWNPSSDIPLPMHASIPNAQWLQVTVKPNSSLGLPQDVFYWGLTVGDSEDQAAGASATVVNSTDEVNARNNFRGTSIGQTPATLADPWDYDRDRNVNSTDQVIARTNPTNTVIGTRISALKMITTPP